MIIYTCPECGRDLLSEVLTCMPPIYRDYCPSCGWSHSKEEEVVRIPFGGNSLKMRDATLEELQSVEDYIGSISVPTKINFNDFYDNFDTPSVCNNCGNNPKNGGSVICNCILGQQTIY